MSKETYQDDVFILRVQNWQTADKLAVCFSRLHGKISFIAYGASYPRSTSGRLVQPFSQLNCTFAPGRKLETLRSCESIIVPKEVDLEIFAYGAVIAEVAESLTSEGESQPEVYGLLLESFELLAQRNKRLVTISTLLKLLAYCGFAPELNECTSCHEPVKEDGFFSLVQGGFLCKKCAIGDEMPFSLTARNLMDNLMHLDFNAPPDFMVKGKDLMELEQILYKFILYQTDKPLKSLDFLAQIEKNKPENIKPDDNKLKK